MTMTEALTLGIDVGGGPWQRRDKSDAAALALADRHYSRQTRRSNQIGPPGRKLVFVTPCERAVWMTHWPEAGTTLDDLDCWRCSIFRNEGAGLSSDLIVAAMLLTAELWSDRPADGWVTWVDTKLVRSTNPGFCFLKAGWRRDADYRRRNRIRFFADVTS